MPDLFAYTDGACSGNPGPGGWGVLLLARDGAYASLYRSQQAQRSTNAAAFLGTLPDSG